MKSLLPLTVLVLLGSDCGTARAELEYPRSELLVEPAELAEPDTARGSVVLDVRTQEDYDQGHVPGARRVDHDAWKEAFGLELMGAPDVRNYYRGWSQWGNSEDTPVVVKDRPQEE